MANKTTTFTLRIVSPIAMGHVSINDLVTEDPVELAQNLARLEESLIAGLQSADHVTTLSAEEAHVALSAIESAVVLLNHLPYLRRYEAAIDALRDHAVKDSNQRARIAANRLLGRPDHNNARPPTYNAAEILEAYRYFTVGAMPSEQSGGDFLALWWSQEADAYPPLDGRRAIEAIRQIFNFPSLDACLQYLKTERAKLPIVERFKLPAIRRRDE